VSSLPHLFRHAVRRLGRAPAFSVAAALTLMLGVGATTAVFSVVNGVLLRPLPFPRSDRLVDLSHTLAISGVTHVDQSDATFLYYRKANRVFQDVAAYRSVGVNLSDPGRGSNAARSERVAAARVSASAFGVLRVSPRLGRTFRDEEDRPDAPPVVVIGERLWERDFAGDPSIVGRRVEVDGAMRQVVGIVPATFRWPASTTELWLPIGIDPANTATAAFDYRGVARLRDGVTVERAQAELQRLLPQVPVAFPGRLTVAAIEITHMRAVVRPLRDVVIGDIGRVLWVVFGAAACVLLIACANVTNLFLVRLEGRQHELAVRRALGASRLSVGAELLAEGIVVAAAGAMLGIALAAAAMRILPSLHAAIGVPRLDEVSIDGRVLLLALLTTIVAIALVSAAPVFALGRTSPSAALNAVNRSTMLGGNRHSARQAFVVAQVAIGLVLLGAAGLMARSFANLRSVEPGFDATHAVEFRVALPRAGYAAPRDPAVYIARALDAIAAVPGVQVTAAASKLPLLDEGRRDTALFVQDHPLAPGVMPNVHQLVFATSDYFRALGVPLVAGQTFERMDANVARREMVVSRALAARYWPNARDAVGKRVRMGPKSPWFTIIGVAGDVRGSGLDEPPDEIIYLPMVTALGGGGDIVATDSLWTPREIAFVARSTGDPAAVSARIQRTVRSIDATVPSYGSALLRDVVEQAAARTSFTLLLLGAAAAAALALALVGIYGVISYSVTLRGRELAVRLALGAQPRDLQLMVTRQVAVLAIVGVVLGLAGAAALTRVLARLLFGVSPTDPLALAAAAAGWLPARRAARTDPTRALQAQ
jgi:putative ABC transport system permease protein